MPQKIQKGLNKGNCTQTNWYGIRNMELFPILIIHCIQYNYLGTPMVKTYVYATHIYKKNFQF